MEHRKKGRKLKRTASHKKALLSNLSMALVLHKRIVTTLAKAKELRLYVEPLLTKAKKAHLNKDKSPETYVHYSREIKKFLKNKEAVNTILKDIAPKITERNGGYTRVLKTGFRKGDGGDEAIIELVDFGVIEKSKAETTKTTDKKKSSAKSTEKNPVKKSQGKKSAEEKKEKAPKQKAVKKTAEEPAKDFEKNVEGRTTRKTNVDKGKPKSSAKSKKSE